MKKITSFTFGLFSLLLLSSCSVSVETNRVREGNAVRTVSERQINDILLNGKVYSALWQQNAGEFQALCYQAYNLAKRLVDEKINQGSDRPIAIVTDIDETILDNSPYAVTQALQGKEFNQDTWLEWTSKGEAVPYPGAIDFFNYAASKNITIFYVTNRNVNDKPGTLKNLKRLGFPYADENHVIVMTDTSNKKKRREKLLEKYDVFMYLGDNLTDFSEVFYKKSQQERNQLVDEMSNEFGETFIVLPNSGYGDWESALPNFNHGLSPKEKDKAVLQNLRTY